MPSLSSSNFWKCCFLRSGWQKCTYMLLAKIHQALCGLIGRQSKIEPKELTQNRFCPCTATRVSDAAAIEHAQAAAVCRKPGCVPSKWRKKTGSGLRKGASPQVRNQGSPRLPSHFTSILPRRRGHREPAPCQGEGKVQYRKVRNKC